MHFGVHEPAFFCGFRVIENPLAVKTEPLKIHKKRRGQRESYHRRVQKKWTKRYGTKQVPMVYLVNNSVFGGHGETLVAHPMIAMQMR